MAKKNQRAAKKSEVRVRTTAETKAADKPPVSTAAFSRRGGRETVDALVVAFVLAFLIRTFVAEMFVIPTGSMAPTLMGRHKDVFCEKCGERFKINSSDDTENLLPQLQREIRIGRLTRSGAQQELDAMRCIAGQCPQCRYVNLVDDEGVEALLRVPPSRADEGDQDANFSGDRLLVSKYAYSFSDPARWDVAVFKYPGDSVQNYIKRVVGLPDEELRVFDGDLWTRPLEQPEQDFQIARKPPEVVEAMSQMVHDTHNEPAVLVDSGWPLSWSGPEWEVALGEPVSVHGAAVYQPRYRATATAETTAWLRYQHTPPTETVWQTVLAGEGAEIADRAKPALVTDHTPYNTQLKLNEAARKQSLSLAPIDRQNLGRLGLHWVGDLILEADLTIESDEGLISLDLVEAGDHFGVTIDVANGMATFWRQPFESDERTILGETATPIRGTGHRQIRLANVDDQLLLWIDGSPVDTEIGYQRDATAPATAPRTSESDPGDLSPAGVGIAGGSVLVERLVLKRDGYYIAVRWDEPGRQTDIPPDAFEELGNANYESLLLALPSEPELWPALQRRQHVDFPIDQGQLFVMGDNSGQSLDARLWTGGNGPMGGGKPGGPYLERKQLVGKAVCVYWPHAWYSLPFTNRLVPVWPNFDDMRIVR